MPVNGTTARRRPGRPPAEDLHGLPGTWAGREPFLTGTDAEAGKRRARICELGN